MSDTTTQTSISQVGTMIVPVADQDRAIEFYVEKLGFEKRTDIAYGNGDRWVEVAPPGAATTIALAIPPEGKPAKLEGGCVAFQSADIDATHAELQAKGVDVDEAVSRFGDPVPPMFWFNDPDGNRHLVVER